MPIHWRSQIDIDEENRYGRVLSEIERGEIRQMTFARRDVVYTPPEHLTLPADKLLIRLRKALDPVREDDLRHDADLK